MKKQQAVVLCEGFDDRGFLAAWLVSRGCRDARARGVATDPWGRRVGAGRFAFYTPTGAFILLVPVHGREKLPKTAKMFLEQHATHELSALVCVYDSDSTAPGFDSKFGALESVLEQGDERGILTKGVAWGCGDSAHSPGVPTKQTLERLVCASIVAVYRERAGVVANWLAAPPATDRGDVKGHFYSYVAKWYASHGPTQIYEQLWKDLGVARELKARLSNSGAWEVIEGLVRSAVD